MADTLNTRLQLINFEVYQSGKRLLGLATVDLPTITGKTVDITGAGISGEISFPTLGFPESIELSLNWRSINDDLSQLNVQRAVDITCYGAEQLYNHSSGKIGVQQVKITFRGVPKVVEFGKFEPASTTDSKNTFEIIFLKIEVGGKAYIELDKINYKYIVDGVDYLAEVRSALNI